MKKLKDINHVRFYKDRILIVKNDLIAICLPVDKQQIKFILHDIDLLDKKK